MKDYSSQDNFSDWSSAIELFKENLHLSPKFREKSSNRNNIFTLKCSKSNNQTIKIVKTNKNESRNYNIQNKRHSSTMNDRSNKDESLNPYVSSVDRFKK